MQMTNRGMSGCWGTIWIFIQHHDSPVVATKQGRYLVERLVLGLGNDFVGEDPEEGQEDAERQEDVVVQCSLTICNTTHPMNKI